MRLSDNGPVLTLAKTGRVLVVDDEPSIRDAVATALRYERFVTGEAPMTSSSSTSCSPTSTASRRAARKVFGGPQTGSAYELISHAMLIVVVTVPSIWAMGVVAIAVWRYWRDTHGRVRDLLRPRPWAAVVVAFAIAPYTKFVHWVFRLLAVYKNNLDLDLGVKQGR